MEFLNFKQMFYIIHVVRAREMGTCHHKLILFILDRYYILWNSSVFKKLLEFMVGSWHVSGKLHLQLSLFPANKMTTVLLLVTDQISSQERDSVYGKFQFGSVSVNRTNEPSVFMSLGT